jgi:hypothetical protein
MQMLEKSIKPSEGILQERLRVIKREAKGAAGHKDQDCVVSKSLAPCTSLIIQSLRDSIQPDFAVP